MASRIIFETTENCLSFLQSVFRRSSNCDALPASVINFDSPLSMSRLVSAVANSRGGNIFIGCQTKGKKVVRFDGVAEEAAHSLVFQLSTCIFPAIEGVESEFYLLNEADKKGIVHLFVPNSGLKPHMAVDNRYYFRHGLKEMVMEEQQVRLMYGGAGKARMELAGIINTNGIPDIRENVVEALRFYPKFLIRNAGNVPARIYKFELFIPSDLHDTSYEPLQNYFNRLEGIYSVFSFPSRAPVFQGETFAVAEAKLMADLTNLKTFEKNDIRLVLFSESGVNEYQFKLIETFTYDRKPLSLSMFSANKLLNPKI
ncbi:MAG: hypothetical protein CVU05_04280 [Bacteroidetes bacterium HGW-Bacteroidetes-21]|jgi:hypothetical protein|nr:MAG: hypothetical protein CVU05_04280 [Bacteroidetes bacterium HGW-Bacteroidetes-21]